MKHFFLFIPALLFVLAGLSSCDDPLRNQQRQAYYANIFDKNTLQTYYLWNAEISDKLDGWKESGDPAEQVLDARYRTASGQEVDRWTQFLPAYSSFMNYVSGESTGTFVYDFLLTYLDEGHTQVAAVVTLTYADGPAARAGLKRGDPIVKVNGKAMTPDIPAEDNPFDGCQLGDPGETLLAAALSACGFSPTEQRAARDAAVARKLDAVSSMPVRTGDGYRILLGRPVLPVQ